MVRLAACTHLLDPVAHLLDLVDTDGDRPLVVIRELSTFSRRRVNFPHTGFEFTRLAFDLVQIGPCKPADVLTVLRSVLDPLQDAACNGWMYLRVLAEA